MVVNQVRGRFLLFVLLALCLRSARAQSLCLPTANRALFDAKGEERFFVGTAGKPWTTGTFGCVRSQGRQMHEGLDIKCLRRDSRGEPTDPVMASADGTVVYLSRKPALSNYGNYLVLRHQIGGVELYSLYAHLKNVREDLMIGQAVKAGELLALMGRTTNTGEGISRDRAHVHFELDLLINDRFPAWFRKASPAQRNDHGAWNGQNLLGLDPRLIFLEERRQTTNFSLLNFIGHQTELCRVFVRATRFPWLTRYPSLVQGNPLAGTEGVAGYEISLNYNGVPFRLIPRAASEVQGRSRFELLSVDEGENRRNPCRGLVVKRGGRWRLGHNGEKLLELLTF